MKRPWSLKHCPSCGARATCTDSRPSRVGTIRRRYRCRACGRRWSTMEIEASEYFKMPGRGLVVAALQQVERSVARLRARIDPPEE